ncbi:MAG TPA: crosslink repair DNA glycosylase YcaQ family protein, partial [Rubricoccaceae bacterium]
TYALMDERVPAAPAVPRDEAVARLALRYVRSHGPATVHDLAWWSGLTVGDARAGIEAARADLVSETVGRAAYWLAAPAGPATLDRPVVHLLPNYDEHVVAYRDHGPTVDPAIRGTTIQRGNALDLHLVARDGLVVGGWRRSVTAREATVETALLVDLTGPERGALAAAADAYGRALGVPVAVRERG